MTELEAMQDRAKKELAAATRALDPIRNRAIVRARYDALERKK